MSKVGNLSLDYFLARFLFECDAFETKTDERKVSEEGKILQRIDRLKKEVICLQRVFANQNCESLSLPLSTLF